MDTGITAVVYFTAHSTNSLQDAESDLGTSKKVYAD